MWVPRFPQRTVGVWFHEWGFLAFLLGLRNIMEEHITYQLSPCIAHKQLSKREWVVAPKPMGWPYDRPYLF